MGVSSLAAVVEEDEDGDEVPTGRRLRPLL